jgi:hypothetical protein
MVQVENGMSARLKAERSDDAGDDARQRDGQDDQQRDLLAPEERVRAIAAAQSVPRISAIAVETPRPQRQESAAQMSGRFQATPNHLQRQAGRRELVGGAPRS